MGGLWGLVQPPAQGDTSMARRRCTPPEPELRWGPSEVRAQVQHTTPTFSTCPQASSPGPPKFPPHPWEEAPNPTLHPLQPLRPGQRTLPVGLLLSWGPAAVGGLCPDCVMPPGEVDGQAALTICPTLAPGPNVKFHLARGLPRGNGAMVVPEP